MIESIFQLKWVVSRHQQAPLFKERKQFLAHCQQQGTSHKALNNMAPELIAVIRFLRMEELREVSLEEIKLAAEAWAAEQRSNPRARSYAKSASYFIFVAKKWLRFHGKLKLPSPPHARFANELDDFVAYMASEQGLSPISIRSHRWKRSKFLSCRRPLWMMLMSSLHSKRITLESRIGFHRGSGSALILPSRGAPRLVQGRNSRRNPRSQDLSGCRLS
jgi:hypothetical protein